MDYQTRPLSKADCKLINQEKRLGDAFFYIFTFIALILLIFISYYKPLLYISIILLVLGEVVSHHINRNYNKDLRLGQKHVYIKEIQELMVNPEISETNQQFIPEPQRISNFHDGYGIKAGNLTYIIDQATYDSLQGQTHCEVHYAPTSATFLGVHPIQK